MNARENILELLRTIKTDFAAGVSLAPHGLIRFVGAERADRDK
jgi:hypothetical protein